MTWTDSQQIALAVLPKISSLFSLSGSVWIAIEVASCASKRSHPYHRMLFAMSVYDIAESIGNFMSTWPIPRVGTGDDQVWAMGNEATCTIQGFFLTTSVAVPIYNAFLALFYLLVINYNVSDRTLRKVVEPAIHGIAFLWAFGTGISSAALGLLNDANLWCWIAPFPAGCLDSTRYGDQANCERGDNAWIYRWAFYFAPLWGCIFFATICTLFVYRRVKSLDERTLRYRRPETFGTARTNSRRRSTRGPSWHSPSSSRELELTPTHEDEATQRAASRRPSLVSLTFGSRRGSSQRSSIFSLATEEQKDNVFLSGVSESNEVADHDPSYFRQWRLDREIYREDYTRSVEVAHQAVFYLGTFYVTHIWSTTNRTVQQLNLGGTSFGLILLHSWFDPFQGFLNFLVYQRPRYLKVSQAHPDLGRTQITQTILRFSFLPDTTGTTSVENESESRSTESKPPRRRERNDQSTGGSGSAPSSVGSVPKQRVSFAMVDNSITNPDLDPLSTIAEESIPATALVRQNRFNEAQQKINEEMKVRTAAFQIGRVEL